jgi:hypothetical protein
MAFIKLARASLMLDLCKEQIQELACDFIAPKPTGFQIST